MMTRLLIIITCIVVLTVHWGTFTDKVDLSKIFEAGHLFYEKVKE